MSASFSQSFKNSGGVVTLCRFNFPLRSFHLTVNVSSTPRFMPRAAWCGATLPKSLVQLRSLSLTLHPRSSSVLALTSNTSNGVHPGAIMANKATPRVVTNLARIVLCFIPNGFVRERAALPIAIRGGCCAVRSTPRRCWLRPVRLARLVFMQALCARRGSYVNGNSTAATPNLRTMYAGSSGLPCGRRWPNLMFAIHSTVAATSS